MLLLVEHCGETKWAIPENIRTIPRTASRNSEGKGGSLNWNSEGMGGYLQVEFWRHGGGVRSGIYTGDRQEFIPWKLFFIDILNQFVNRTRTSDISSLTPNNMIKRFLEYKYNHLTGFWEPFYVDSPFFNPCTRYNIVLFFLRNMFCLSLRTPFEAHEIGNDCWPWWLKFKMAETKYTRL